MSAAGRSELFINPFLTAHNSPPCEGGDSIIPSLRRRGRGGLRLFYPDFGRGWQRLWRLREKARQALQGVLGGGLFGLLLAFAGSLADHDLIQDRLRGKGL